MPSASEIEAAIRSIIADLYATDNLADLTVKRVRVAAEKKCKLRAGYLKEENAWRERSKTFIEEEAVRQGETLQTSDKGAEEPEEKLQFVTRSPGKRSSQQESDVPKKRQKTEPTVRTTPAKKDDVATAKKPIRKPQKAKTVESSDDEEPVQKGRRKAPSKRNVIESSDESAVEEDEPEPNNSGKSSATNGASNGDIKISTPKKSTPKKSTPKKPTPKKSQPTTPKQQPKSKNITKQEKNAKSSPTKSQSPPKRVDESDSDMSSLIDDIPKPKKTKNVKASTTKAEKPTKSKITKGKAKDESLDPKDAEIKSLQGWLLKCGVRKLWHKELAPYDTQKEKIAHLKQMLKDVGMGGRYSQEKARQIKEQRELAADLEAVQDFSKHFGAKGERENRGGAIQALQDMGFNIEDGEETD
jgi:hypothetical protein